MYSSQILKECSECEVMGSDDETTYIGFIWTDSKLSILEMFSPQSFLITMFQKGTFKLVKHYVQLILTYVSHKAILIVSKIKNSSLKKEKKRNRPFCFIHSYRKLMITIMLNMSP